MKLYSRRKVSLFDWIVAFLKGTDYVNDLREFDDEIRELDGDPPRRYWK